MRPFLALFIFLFSFTATAHPVDRLTSEQLAEKVKLFDRLPLSEVQIVSTQDFVDDCGVTYNTEITVQNPEKKIFKFTVTRPFSKDPVPVVLGLPTIRGPLLLEARLDSLFCKNNIAYVLADVVPRDFDSGENGIVGTNTSMIAAVKALRLFLDYLETQPFPGEYSIKPFDLNRIGLLGLSNGAGIGTLLMSVDSRIQAGVLMGGSGNLPHTLAYSSDRQVDAFRSAQMERLKLKTSDEFEKLMRHNISVSPAQMAPLIDKSKVFQIIIEPDFSVPTADQIELWEGLGRPEHAVVEGSHTGAIVNAVYMNSILLREFLEKKLLIEK